MAAPSKRLRVGVVGAGEVAQVVHLPTLSLLCHLFTTTVVCDLSLKVRATYHRIKCTDFSI
jgi:predicted dehydrogenase